MKKTINQILAEHPQVDRIAELLVDSAIGSNKASGIPEPLEGIRKKSVEVEIIDEKTFKLRKKIMGFKPEIDL